MQHNWIDNVIVEFGLGIENLGFMEPTLWA